MSALHKVAKLDIPFRTDDEIHDLVARFEQQAWPYERWTHRAHLAVAVAYLRMYPLSDAIDRIRRNIQLYNRACGDSDGYHETITLAFMQLISGRLSSSAEPSLAAIVDDLFRECSLESLLKYYSPERLWSPEAKAGWIPPDLTPFD